MREQPQEVSVCMSKIGNFVAFWLETSLSVLSGAGLCNIKRWDG